MSMDLTNKVGRLPDYYDKRESSNNRKILELARQAKQDFADTLDDIRAASDMLEATGEALDIWGSIYGVDREGDSDDAYRLRIQIAQLKDKVQIDYSSWYRTILEIFDCEPETLEIESTGDPFEYRFVKFPFSRCNELGITVERAEELILDSLPVTSNIETLQTNHWSNIANFTWAEVKANGRTWRDVLLSADFRS